MRVWQVKQAKCLLSRKERGSQNVVARDRSLGEQPHTRTASSSSESHCTLTLPPLSFCLAFGCFRARATWPRGTKKAEQVKRSLCTKRLQGPHRQAAEEARTDRVGAEPKPTQGAAWKTKKTRLSAEKAVWNQVFRQEKAYLAYEKTLQNDKVGNGKRGLNNGIYSAVCSSDSVTDVEDKLSYKPISIFHSASEISQNYFLPFGSLGCFKLTSILLCKFIFLNTLQHCLPKEADCGIFYVPVILSSWNTLLPF